MTLPTVNVKKDGLSWACRWIEAGTLKCGRCGRGLVLPRIGDKCRVCGAKVVLMVGGPASLHRKQKGTKR